MPLAIGLIAFTATVGTPREVHADWVCYDYWMIVGYDGYGDPIWELVEWCDFTPDPVYGCTDPSASNYNPSATVEDGSCVYPPPPPPPPPPVYGCTDPNATNYNPSATVEDGSCQYPPPPPPPPPTSVPTSISLIVDQYLQGPPQPYDRYRRYQIRDQDGNPMRGDVTPLYISETYSPSIPNGNCTSQPVQTGGGYATADGTFWDDFRLSGAPAGCSSSSTQTIYVNGQLLATFSVTWTPSGVSVQ